MPKRCTVEVHPRLGEVNVALHAGVPWREIERQFGIPKDTVGRHARNCLGLIGADHKAVVSARRTAKRTLETAARAADAPPIATPEDVLAELRYLYGETKTLYERAKASHDTRLMDKAIGQAGTILDRFAKSFGMFTDTMINVNPVDAKIVAVVQSMTTDELREYIRTAPSVPIAGAVSE